MTFEELKEFINNTEDYLVRVEGDLIFEYATPEDEGFEYNALLGADEEYKVDDDLLNIVEIYTYSEMDINLTNILKAIKEEDKERPMILALDGGNYVIKELEERVMERGVNYVVDRILKLKKTRFV